MSNRKTVCIQLIVGAMWVLFSLQAGAEAKVVWCSKWLTNYSDSDGLQNSDWAWESGTQARYAQHALVNFQILNGSSWDWVPGAARYLWTYSGGYFCTEAVSVTPGATYRAWVSAYMQSGNRYMVVMTDASTWSSPGVWAFYKEFDIPSSLNTTVTKYIDPENPNHLSKQSNVAHVGRQLLALGNVLSWPNDSSERILVNMDKTECDCGGCYYGYDSPFRQVCNATDATQIRKFVSGHELGHALQMMNVFGPGGNATYGADDSTSNSLWVPTSDRCKRPAYKHFIQSREYVGAAQKEGFSHFIGAALFNAREPYAGFKYYRNDVLYTPPGGTYGSYDMPWLNWGHQTQNMKTSPCNVSSLTMSGIMGLGMEWDWAEFFWQLWAHGTSVQQWTVGQIFDAWDETQWTTVDCASNTNCTVNYPNGTYKLGRPYQTLYEDGVVNTMSDSTKRLRFNDLSKATAVNYLDYEP